MPAFKSTGWLARARAEGPGAEMPILLCSHGFFWLTSTVGATRVIGSSNRDRQKYGI